MSTATDILIDGYTRVRENVATVVDGLSPADIASRPDAEANSIAWLLWHLTRVQDDHLAELIGAGQLWTRDGWQDRFGLPFASSATGYGQSPAEAAAVVVESPGLLVDYHEAVYASTCAFVSTLTDADFARIVDRSWTPPVTLAVRLVSVIDDGAQHVGQAAYVRGLIERRR